MSEFVKPKTTFVSDSNYIENLMNVNLQKDLHDNEEVCPHCHGTGMTVVDNVYGLSEDPDKSKGYFPYKHQSISFCQHCYNGIVHRCKLCGELLKRGKLVCDCEQAKAVKLQEETRKKKEAFDKAPVAPKEVVDNIRCFYSEYFGHNDGYFLDFEEFFEWWAEDHEEDTTEDRPEYVWITEPVEMSIDAQNIIEQATDDLYEDASEDISSEAKKELQDFLDDWCKRCGVSTTYYESHKYKVRIPWEEY